MNKLLLMALLGAGAWLMHKRNQPAPEGMSLADAARVLNINLSADRDTINAAHRRLITRVHPDRGGSVQLASQANQARDVLTRRLGAL